MSLTIVRMVACHNLLTLSHPPTTVPPLQTCPLSLSTFPPYNLWLFLLSHSHVQPLPPAVHLTFPAHSLTCFHSPSSAQQYLTGSFPLIPCQFVEVLYVASLLCPHVFFSECSRCFPCLAACKSVYTFTYHWTVPVLIDWLLMGPSLAVLGSPLSLPWQWCKRDVEFKRV